MRKLFRPGLAAAAAAAAVVVLGGAVRPDDAPGALQAQAEAAVSNPGEWTILAWSVDRGQTLFAINADQALVPASNNKVFSSIWALELLGPRYRFRTDLLVTGPVEGGVVRGDVVIRGSGDPAFGYPGIDKDPMKSPRAMVQTLVRKGIRVIEGGVLADATVFDSLHYGPDWPKDTGNGAAMYAPTVSGLPFQRNMLWVEMTPGVGKGYELEPHVPEIPVVNKARPGGGRGFAVRQPGEDTITIKGGISGKGPHRYPIGVANPALLSAAAIRQALVEAGIQVRGPIRLGATPEGAKLVHRHYSITLAEMLDRVNRDSDNFFAEHLWKAACAAAIGQGSYTDGGAASASFFHQRAKVPFGQLYQADGSGLSARNRTSAFAMVNALHYAHRRPYSQVFHESLAIAGDADGSMRRMFNGTPAEGNLHAKTGYIRGVRSLSGFVKTRGGQTVIFSFIYNGRNTSGARGVQIQLGNLLAEYAG
ncbi:MAG TPA: D-alanyl-D-alanine carboxypeptidase/D-alanyl-D-alanine-endopeptidase [Longimicrobiaceae bacterium]|nr:D-alanyl-D-alanine carboxypeptidase/D-alanyl-D-alanine-endopeptidase [Longimicrobiaceae bacterium]